MKPPLMLLIAWWKKTDSKLVCYVVINALEKYKARKGRQHGLATFKAYLGRKLCLLGTDPRGEGFYLD